MEDHDPQIRLRIEFHSIKYCIAGDEFAFPAFRLEPVHYRHSVD